MGRILDALDQKVLDLVIRRAGSPPVLFSIGDKVRRVAASRATSTGGSAASSALVPAIQSVAGDVQWQGPEVVFKDHRAFWRAVMEPEKGFGDAYSDGSLMLRGDLVDTLVILLSHLVSNTQRRGYDPMKRSVLGRIHRARRNTLGNSREHIHHHYDLGNDFYRLWLDERMVYTCAYYEQSGFSLEQAQVAKLDHVCRKLQLTPGQKVLELGCGWGALALHMAEHYDVDVVALNISREQLGYARERARRMGLDEQVSFVEADYRDAPSRFEANGFDAVVSVGMLEHVGVENYPALGQVVASLLAPHGRALIHSVGRNRPEPPNAWLESRIFPGSYPASLREMMGVFEKPGLSVLDVENLRLHYALTLREWLRRFDLHLDRIRSMYDESFVRAWRLYLGGCAAGFESGGIQLFQILCAHATDNGVPMNRRHMYAESNARRA